ncbi:MAG TPA: hypothetical protein DD670_05135 [Planctomycetaceae bacterium]|nr:hypothetical protein [Planctomycetaceae bacterium]
MKRPLAVVGLLILLAGCASRKPLAPDPFFGRTAISPPGTRSFRQHGERDPYYAASQPTTAAAQDLTPGDGGIFPDRVASWRGVSRREREADSVRRAMSWNIPPDASQPDSSVQHASHTDTSEESFVYVLQPRAVAAETQPSPPVAASRPTSATSSTFSAASPSPASPVASVASGSAWQEKSTTRPASATDGIVRAQGGLSKFTEGSEPRYIRLPNSVIDLRDLPDRGSRAASRARIDGNVRLASSTVAIAGQGSSVVQPRSTFATPTDATRTSDVRPAIKSLPSRYEHDPEYAWLRGRLEYSEVDRRWKLRYIPINDETDQFGGSVVLADSSLLSGLQKGDFVEVRGRLVTDEAGQWGYAPVYEVAQSQPVRQ